MNEDSGSGSTLEAGIRFAPEEPQQEADSPKRTVWSDNTSEGMSSLIISSIFVDFFPLNPLSRVTVVTAVAASP